MNDAATKPTRRRAPWGAVAIGLMLGLIGLWLFGGGIWLLTLGGSAYYAIAGAICLVSALCYCRGRVGGGRLLYLLLFAGTCVWAVGEVGLDFWQLTPRVAGPLVFAVIVALHGLFSGAAKPSIKWGISGALALCGAAFLASLIAMPATTGGAGASPAPTPGALDDWPTFGGKAEATRYSPAAQITPANVGALKPAWTYRTGDMPAAYPGEMAVHTVEVTPIKIGDLIYTCTPHDIVVALDAQTGAVRWRYDPHINMKGVFMKVCRGVAHYQAAPDAADCKSRIIYGTLDARLLALDALTGKPCESFGKKGTVALLDGMGVSPAGYYIITSPPAIVNGVVVLGGFVFDGQETREPSGVIRGYDANTGALRWAWDSGARDENAIPHPGQQYSRGSPNSWSVMSADPALGLVYIPMGNATPDYVGMHRTPEQNRYSSSVVALDAATGKRRWHFQTVHHDLWDYDLGSQPVLFTMPMPGGGSAPALAQPTKQGDIYILDRRTGKPLTQVVERRAPAGDIPGERYSPTQPTSVGFPSPLTKERLEEADMWGATPLDQLWCRIRYRSVDYKGRYTPPSTRGILQYPSNFGVMDWGSVAIDERRGLMLVNSSHLPMTTTLIPRATAEKQGNPGHAHGAFAPQRGTPYAVNPVQFLSPLGLPCNAPPWGKLTAIDLASRKIVWQRPFGTSHDHAPLGIATPGSPNLGGAVVTAGGVTFIAATIDHYLRAFDTRTGAELWRARLPAGGQAAPITYVSRKDGKQYVVIAAGGHQMLETKLGDYVVAYRLP